MEFVFTNKAKRVTQIAMLVGLITLVAGFLTDHSDHQTHFWANILVNGFYFFGIALGALFFYALQYATETGWSVVFKRVFEGIFSFLPYGAAILVIVFLVGTFGGHHLYHWMDHTILEPFLEDGVTPNPDYDSLIAGKTAYLNKPFFWVRTLVYLATFLIFAKKYRERSLLEDQVGGTDIHFINYKKAAVFLVLFAVFSSTLSWDWIMSIDTHWFSTLFGWYTFSGLWVSFLITAVLIILFLKNNGYLKNVNDSHIHDMGKWMFAISFLWTYLWFSQFLLIWYSDIPEEVTYFIERIEHFKVPFFMTFFINFVLPMVMLMARDTKKNNVFLIMVGSIIFLGHWMDAYLMIVPGTLHHWDFGWMEIGLFLGFLGLFLNRVLTTLTKAPLEPKNHPYLDECMQFHI